MWHIEYLLFRNPISITGRPGGGKGGGEVIECLGHWSLDKTSKAQLRKHESFGGEAKVLHIQF